jgi:hypothetical protein
MAPFASFLRRTASPSQSLQQARAQGAKMQAAEEPDSGWSFYHSSDDLLSGLDVMEHTAPPALLGLLREALAA